MTTEVRRVGTPGGQGQRGAPGGAKTRRVSAWCCRGCAYFATVHLTANLCVCFFSIMLHCTGFFSPLKRSTKCEGVLFRIPPDG